tara:strand:- start:520 stop:843 length:324 start_codon:yes stop_codon:yes gene_type:complete
VLKQNGSRATFSRTKLLNGISRACDKTSIGSTEIEMIVDQIESKIQLKHLREVASAEIGEMVLSELRKISEVAYIRFASVYQKFHGINDFITALNQLKAKEDKFATV